MQSIALDVLYPNIHHMYLMIMNIATPIPKIVLDDPAVCRHDPPNMVPQLAHSVFIIMTWLLVQSIALDVLYQNLYQNDNEYCDAHP